MAYHRIDERQQNVRRWASCWQRQIFHFLQKQRMLTNRFFSTFFKWLRGRMEDFSAKTNCFVRFALLSVMRENIISGEVSPALWIEWSLYKCPLTFFLDFSLWNTLFVFQMSNIINKQRRYGFFSLFSPFFRVSQYLSKQRDREFLCLILWGSVHVYVREMRRRDWNGEEGGGFSVGSIGMDAPGSFRGWCHWWRSRSILPATVCLWGRDSETGQGDSTVGTLRKPAQKAHWCSFSLNSKM